MKTSLFRWIVLLALQVDACLALVLANYYVLAYQESVHTEQVRVLHELERDALRFLRANPTPKPSGTSL